MAARWLLVATGLCDELPGVPGLVARWGNDVVHCPYCHGWEVWDKRIGVLATGPMAMHQVLLFRQLSPHVTLLRHTGPAVTGEQSGQLAALGVAVVEEIEASADRLTGPGWPVAVGCRSTWSPSRPRFMARAELLAPLGLSPVEIRAGEYLVGTRVEADASGATAVPGVWVAGNLADPQAQVVTSAAAGLAADAAINLDLVTEDSSRAVGGYARSA